MSDEEQETASIPEGQIIQSDDKSLTESHAGEFYGKVKQKILLFTLLNYRILLLTGSRETCGSRTEGAWEGFPFLG